MEIYFHYQANPTKGDLEICAGYDCSSFNKEQGYEFENRTTVQSSMTPRQLLDALERSIVERTGERSNTKDIWDDNDPKSRDLPRSFGYLIEDTWSGLGRKDREDPQERRKVDERNKTRHSKIYPIYKEFISRL